jgi:hypothetical protein
VKVKIEGGGMSATGTAPADAPTMDPYFARVMLGVACYEQNADGSRGRSIDPTFVKASREWLIGERLTQDQRDFIRKTLKYWNAADACEALASRDPGQVHT